MAEERNDLIGAALAVARGVLFLPVGLAACWALLAMLQLVILVGQPLLLTALPPYLLRAWLRHRRKRQASPSPIPTAAGHQPLDGHDTPASVPQHHPECTATTEAR